VSRRGVIAGAVLVAWVAGLAILVQREFFRGNVERMAEVALRVSPETYYYSLERDGVHVGYVASAIDTTARTVEITDLQLSDPPNGMRELRRSAATFSRALTLRSFTESLESPAGNVSARGEQEGDSLVRMIRRVAGADAEAQTIATRGTALHSALIPLVIALGEQPRVGKRITLPVLDLESAAQREVTFLVAAESLFVVPDSAGFDTLSGRWQGVRSDTVRAWQLSPAGDEPVPFSGWIDSYGRLVEMTRGGRYLVRRTAYELAFENWRIGSAARGVPPVDAADPAAIQHLPPPS
jgi:hypothetical protein